MSQETNRNGEVEGGGVAVAGPPESGDMAAIMEALKEMPPSTVAGIRRTFEVFNDGTFEACLEENGMSMAEFAAGGTLDAEKAALFQQIGRMLRDCSVDFLAGIEHLLSLAREGAAG